MDETILTLDELKKTLGINPEDSSQDEDLEVLLSVLAPYLYDQTGTWFGSSKEATETLSYDSVVFVDGIPVLSVEEVRVGYAADHSTADMRLLDASGYRWNREGRLMLNTSFEYRTTRYDYDDVYVKYTHGVLEVPKTVKEAVKLFAKSYWAEGENNDQTITSVQAGSYKETYQPSGREQQLLAPYVRVRL